MSEFLTSRCIDLLLRSRLRASLFLLGIAVPSLVLAAETARIAIASTLAGSGTLVRLEKALALDPGNAELHHRLGLTYLDGNSQANALAHLQRAVQLSPARAVYWSDLAAACESMADYPCSDRAHQRASLLSPETPLFEWKFANFCLRSNKTQSALEHFQRLLMLDPRYDRSAFRVCLDALGAPATVLENALPRDDPKVLLDFADFVSSQGAYEAASKAWARVMARPAGLSFPLAEPYLERLIASHRDRDALRVWQDLERLGVISKSPVPDRDNLVFNGGFEQSPLNAGFDWRYEPVPYLSLNFSDSPAQQGTRCLGLDFTGKSNDSFEPVYEYVPVAPNRQYVLRAYTRSQAITSDSGPRLRVVDAECAACLDLAGAPTSGTTPWHEVRLEFSTSAQTHLLRLSIWRPRSRTFPTEITGRFWIDAVTLETRVAAKDAPTAPTPPSRSS